MVHNIKLTQKNQSMTSTINKKSMKDMKSMRI